MADQQAIHTARVMLTECRARRQAHGWEFAFRSAQRARRRAFAPVVLQAAAPVMPAQMELFA